MSKKFKQEKISELELKISRFVELGVNTKTQTKKTANMFLPRPKTTLSYNSGSCADFDLFKS